MLEWRFEPAGGGLRLVWRFWAVGGRAHAGMCCCVGSEASRPARGRAARRKRERGQSCNRLLQPNRAGARSNRPPLSLRDSARWTRHYDSVSGRGDHTSTSTGPSLLVVLLLVATRADGAVRGALVVPGLPAPRFGPGRTEGLLPGERRSLAAPSKPPRARAVLKLPSGRGKAASPLQGLLHGALALARKQRVALAPSESWLRAGFVAIQKPSK